MRALTFSTLDPDLRRMLMASLLAHGLLFGFIGIYGRIGSHRDVFFAPVYRVNLVSPPGEEAGGGKETALTETRVHVKSGGAELTEGERQKAIKEALASTKKILEALKSAKGKGPASAQKTGPPEGEKPSPAGTGGPSPSPGGGVIMDPVMAQYYAAVKKKIEEVWSLPGAIFGPTSAWELRIGVRVKRDGRIEDSWLERSSGNTYLDRSALRAVIKASPLPPIPPGIAGDTLDLGLRFTAQEMG